jgi:hypothetical protein
MAPGSRSSHLAPWATSALLRNACRVVAGLPNKYVQLSLDPSTTPAGAMLGSGV